MIARSLVWALFAVSLSARAGLLDQISNQDAGNGLKAVLEKGANAAVAKLGTENGFFQNEMVRIALPRVLDQARPLLKLTGKAQQLDELELAMNRAAESAIPLAKPLLVDAVKTMSVADAKRILTGGASSVTDFFKEKTAATLSAKFLPIVKGVTDRSKLSAKYNAAMGKARELGLAHNEAPTVEAYVAAHAVEGLYRIIAEEEKAIRRDPLGSGSKIISKVFGSLH